MRILLITNMFPHEGSSYYGIFVKEQMESVMRYHPDIEYDVVYIDGKSSKLNYLSTIPKLIKLTNSGRYDLVHIHYGLSGLFSLFMHKIKTPIVVTLHGGDIQIAQNKKVQVWISKHVLRKAKYAFTLNEDMKNLVKKYCANTALCPCSVNTELFNDTCDHSSNKSIKRIVFPNDRKRVVKNFPLFEQVLAILKERYGINTEFTEIKGMSREEVCKLLNNSDLLLMTSISEGSPQVVKEAMACNLPVVTTPVGDVKYLLKDVDNCIVSDTHDANELAECAAQILKRGIVRTNGREQIFRLGLDDKSIADKIYNIYKTLA